MADLDPDTLNKLRVIDLKEHLSARGLITTGLKADLVKRLREAILARQNEECGVAFDDPESRDDSISTEEEGLSPVIAEQQHIKYVEEHTAIQAMKDSQEMWDQERQQEVLEEHEQMEQQRLQEEQSAEQERQLEEEQHKLWVEEQERKHLEEEEQERKHLEEQKKMWAEEQEKKLWAEQQKRLAEEQERMRLEEQQRLLAEEQERIRLEEQQKLLAEEQERQQLEEQQRRFAEEQERRRLEEQQRQLAEEQERRRVEEQQRQLAEEQERRRLEEQQRQLAVEKERRRLEQQQKLLAEEEERRQYEDNQRQLAEEREVRRLEQQQRQLAEEKTRKQLDEQRKLLAEERERKHLQEQQKLIAEEQERKRLEEQKKLMAAEQEKKRLEEQRKLVTEEQERKRKEEQQKLMAKERERKHLEEQRLIEEQEKQRVEEEQRLWMVEQEQKKAEEQQKLLIKEHNRKLAEEDPEKLWVEEQERKRSGKDSLKLPSESDELIRLPQAVEKVFALKTVRAQELGVDVDSVITSVEKDVSSKLSDATFFVVDEVDDMDDVEEDKSKSKESKSRRRKKKKKQKKNFRTESNSKIDTKIELPKEQSVDIDIEYVQDVLDPADPMYSQFIGIFEKFKLVDPEKDASDASADALKAAQNDASVKPVEKKKAFGLDDDDDDDDDEDMMDDDKKDDDKPKLSKRKMKKLSRMTVAELKQKVGRPELVEMHDVTARDPVLLLHLKASRNTVPVPRHWCFKRKYLQGKRGIEKPAFELPDFIKRTGIMEMRQALQEKEDQKTMKAKMRERVRPKLGKIDIDYQKLHDAFFKWQTKPKMTIHGDLYYEGKEFETRLKEKKPGDLSDDLRVALGMPTGLNANKCPPPWLIAMQRYGPPPSYPNLKIPGLNAPIPDSCSFGYHAGGWGKPPVDEMGRPLYGDVFGTQAADNMPQIPEEEIDHTLWGELESESSEEEEEEGEEDEDEEEAKPEDETGLVTPAEGLITPSGFSSIPAGMETPDMIELRKRKTEAEMEGGETPALYTILPEKKTDRVGAAMMGSTHIYDIAAAIPAGKIKAGGTTSVPPQGIEVALDPSELEMDTAAMAARYEQTMREQQSQLAKEDLSDMVAEHAARQKTKRKKQQQDSGKAPKKYKEFKF